MLHRQEATVGVGDRDKEPDEGLAVCSVEPCSESATDGIGVPAVSELGAMAGDFGDQRGVFGLDVGAFDQNLLHLEPFVGADPAVGAGDAHEHEGEGVEVIGGLGVERVESLDGPTNHQQGRAMGFVFDTGVGRSVHHPLLLGCTDRVGGELQ